VIVAIELHDSVIADQRDVPVRAVRLDDDVMRFGMRGEPHRREVDSCDNGFGRSIDYRNLPRRLIGNINEYRGPSGRQTVRPSHKHRNKKSDPDHGTGGVGCFFKMNSPSDMLDTATTPLLKNG